MQNKTWHQDFRRKVEAIHLVIVLDYRLAPPVAGNGNLEKVQARSSPLGLGQVAA